MLAAIRLRSQTWKWHYRWNSSNISLLDSDIHSEDAYQQAYSLYPTRELTAMRLLLVQEVPVVMLVVLPSFVAGNVPTIGKKLGQVGITIQCCVRPYHYQESRLGTFLFWRSVYVSFFLSRSIIHFISSDRCHLWRKNWYYKASPRCRPENQNCLRLQLLIYFLIRWKGAAEERNDDKVLRK